MNLANKITTFRMILIPAIIVLMILYNFNGLVPNFYQVIDITFNIGDVYSLPLSYLIAGVLFIIASLTDFLDGYIARKYNQITTFGKFFDSTADKMLTNSVLIVFTVANFIPIWLCVILICRDFLIDAFRQVLAMSSFAMQANKLGKYRAACQMFGLSLLFFFGNKMFVSDLPMFGFFGWVNLIVLTPLHMATLLSIISAINYIVINKSKINNHPQDSKIKSSKKINSQNKNDINMDKESDKIDDGTKK